jgi:Holliday junction resolvasome RuvABC endonuclease subunit
VIPHPDDAADALAIALCHQASMGLRAAIEQAN